MPSGGGAVVLGVFSELMIQSRVEAVLGAVGETVAALPPEPGAAAAAVRAVGPAVVLLDLSVAPALRSAILGAAREAGCPVLAFGPHVDAEAFAAARQGGAVEVLARGALQHALVPLVAKHRSRLPGPPGMPRPPAT
jgi:hypothetical protein